MLSCCIAALINIRRKRLAKLKFKALAASDRCNAALLSFACNVFAGCAENPARHVKFSFQAAG
jgi:hypothetical protein